MARGKTFDQGERARELFDQGKSCNAIARALGVAPSTISLWAKREGLVFDRSHLEAAHTAAAVQVAARRLDRAATRADIIDRLYLRSQKVLARLEADEFVWHVATELGVKKVTAADPPADAEKSLAASIGIYLDKATRLEQVDAAPSETGVRAMLTQLGEALGL